jgi:hypothetical protein
LQPTFGVNSRLEKRHDNSRNLSKTLGTRRRYACYASVDSENTSYEQTQAGG